MHDVPLCVHPCACARCMRVCAGAHTRRWYLQDIHSRADAKHSLIALTSRYDVDEVLAATAVAHSTNAAFAHWRATLIPKSTGRARLSCSKTC